MPGTSTKPSFGLNTVLLIAFWLILFITSLASRPFLPVDETRYTTVAWEMWLSGEWLVPHLNGMPYSDKPPLMFWLFVLGWRVLGVNEWWPRLLPSLFNLAGLFIVRRLARQLWPANRAAQVLAPWILAGCLLWAIWGGLTMFDNLVAFFVLLGISGILLAWRRQSLRGWILLALGCGLGILAKGPVVYLYILPVGLCAPWWADRRYPSGWPAWYGGLLSGAIAGAVIALAWALPAALSGGTIYGTSILWGQTSYRLIQSFAHARPWWYYLPLLAAVLFPWILWSPLWSGLRKLVRAPKDSATRFCIAWMLPAFAVLCMISGKQPHYLLPLLPSFALLASHALTRVDQPTRRFHRVLPAISLLALGAFIFSTAWEGPASWVSLRAGEIASWTGIVLVAWSVLLLAMPTKGLRWEVGILTITTGVFLAVLHLGAVRTLATTQDVRGIATFVRAAEEEGRAVAHVGKYHGQYQFVGRLRKPLDVIKPSHVVEWANRHERGLIVTTSRIRLPIGDVEPDYVRVHHNYTVMILSSEAILANVLDQRPLLR